MKYCGAVWGAKSKQMFVKHVWQHTSLTTHTCRGKQGTRKRIHILVINVAQKGGHCSCRTDVYGVAMGQCVRFETLSLPIPSPEGWCISR